MSAPWIDACKNVKKKHKIIFIINYLKMNLYKKLIFIINI